MFSQVKKSCLMTSCCSCRNFVGAAGRLVAGVAGFANRRLGVEVVGVVLVDRGLTGHLDGRHEFLDGKRTMPRPSE